MNQKISDWRLLLVRGQEDFFITILRQDSRRKILEIVKLFATHLGPRKKKLNSEVVFLFSILFHYCLLLEVMSLPF